MALGTLLLRLTVGGLMAGHGLQKLTGAFEGPGLDGVEGMMRSLEMHPARRNAVAVASAETFGGAALALGVATPVAAAALVATMVTAVRKVHLKNGVWNSKGGWEYNAVLAAAVAALASDGPGKLSVDALFKRSRWGFGGAVFAIGAGIAGSFAVTEIAKRSVPEPQQDAPAS